MELTFEAGKNMVLVDGHIYFLDEISAHPKGHVYQLFSDYKLYKGISEVLHTVLETKSKFYWVKTTADKNENFPSSSKWTRNILATTNTELTDVHHIPREWFVRKFDVEELFKIALSDFDMADMCEGERYNSMQFFKAGYNANKAEFEKGHLFDIFCRIQMGRIKTIEEFETYIYEIRQPLELPQSITVTKDFKQLIETIWKD